VGLAYSRRDNILFNQKKLGQELFSRCRPGQYHIFISMEMVASGISIRTNTPPAADYFQEHFLGAEKKLMEKTISYRGKKINYSVQGEGKPVILIHGFAEDATIWAEQVNLLKENFRLVVPDIPGSGKSEMVDQNAGMEDHANCIMAIIDMENISACTMIGHSMGGYIALAFAEKYPEQLNGLGLFHSTTYADSEEKKDARKKSISFIRQYGAAAFVEQTTPNLFSENSKKQNPEVIAALINRYSGFDPLSLISYYEAMINRPDRTEVLKEFSEPVMFIIGEEDKAVPMQHSLEQCHIPAVSFVHVANNTAHMGMIEDSRACTTFLDDFLKYIFNK